MTTPTMGSPTAPCPHLLLQKTLDQLRSSSADTFEAACSNCHKLFRVKPLVIEVVTHAAAEGIDQ
jgi:hypothetical protein